MTEVFVAQVTSSREKAAKIDYTDVYFHFRSRVLVSASRANASSHHFALDSYQLKPSASDKNIANVSANVRFLLLMAISVTVDCRAVFQNGGSLRSF